MRFQRQWMTIAAFAILMSGCSLFRGNSFVIPPMDTAQDQYTVAYSAYQEAETYYSTAKETKQTRESIEKAKEALRTVLRRFPEDDTWTPLADLLLAKCYELEGKYSKAADHYQDVLTQYPFDPRIQHVGMYERAVALEAAGDYRQAKQVYKDFIETYGNDPALKDNAEAQRRLLEARKRFRTIQAQ